VLTPFVQKFHSPKSPWEIYKAIYPASGASFFLDSSEYRPPNQVFSYLGFQPYLEVILRKGKIYLRGEEKGVFPASRLFGLLRRLFKKYRYPERSENLFFTGGAVGYWGYELATLFEKIRFRKKPGPPIPALYLGFYRDLIVYDHRKKRYWFVTHLPRDKKMSKKESHKKANDSLNRFKHDIQGEGIGGKSKHTRFSLKGFRPELSSQQFEEMVRRAKGYIAAGDIYQANLSQRFSFHFNGSPLDLYHALRKINPSPFSSFLKIDDIHIVSSSPERLIRKRGMRCETQPIAGTRPRRSPGKSEDDLKQELLSNEKERAEHIMLVDLERNDLGRVCKWRSVKVAAMMKIEKYSHVIHLVSKIVGRMKRGKDAFDLVRTMFPGGTITGCPKIRCMEIIDELEPVARGIYTGSIGYLDFRGDLDLNIVIRTLILHKNKGYLQVGAGIVYDSDPSKEYEETLHKGEALAEALVHASA
jgi:anthranilate/para-aminobenzoate synthase component I